MSHSKSQRPPSLKPAVSREAFRRLQTQRDFQSPKDSTGFQPVVINGFSRQIPPIVSGDFGETPNRWLEGGQGIWKLLVSCDECRTA